MQPEAKSYEADLLSEIDDFKGDLSQYHWFYDEAEASFFKRVAPEDVDTFVASATL
jgi:hypothetical protein